VVRGDVQTAEVARATVSDPDQPPAGWTFQLPKIRDPRLHVAGILVTVQVLGQVSIGFDLSIAQILVAMGTAGLLEVMLTARRTRVIAWPASALLTGNGVALLLRVPGTENGDWFSMRGWWVFSATAALAVLSKYVIRAGDRPLFNPSNFALVVTFLVLGAQFADPQDLWWGPMSPGLALTYAVIIVGGVVITRRLALLTVSVTFGVVFGGLMAALALSGHSIAARWSLEPVAGLEYWTTVVLSPEILIFVFFMITDPRTAARGRSAGMLYGGLVAATSGVLVAFQSTEYATKVALLAGLVLVCRAPLDRTRRAERRGRFDAPVDVLRAPPGAAGRGRRGGVGHGPGRIGNGAARRARSGGCRRGTATGGAARGPASDHRDQRRRRCTRGVTRRRSGPTSHRRGHRGAAAGRPGGRAVGPGSRRDRGDGSVPR